MGHVVRRVLSAQTADRHLVEDLTQETIVRIVATDGRIPADGIQPYAVATAKNLLASHGRGLSVRQRHAHRLVEHTDTDGPEHLTLEREETDALAVALQRLDDDQRRLLVRHEVEGVPLATLAQEDESTPGAIAMRLARARAELRLEFLLAFRHVELPTERCRAVLLALSTGDGRRQQKLAADDHLRACSTCAELAPPIARRDRRIAGWILVPIGEGLRRAWRWLRAHPTASVAATVATAGVATVAVVAAVAITRTDELATQRVSSPPATAAATPPSRTSAPVTSSSAIAATTTPPPTTCPPPAPLEQLDPAAMIGCPIAPTTVTVTDVPADEGFSATSINGQQIWVQLVGTGESPLSIQPGQEVILTGTIAASGATPSGQPYHLEVEYSDLELAG